MQTIRPLAKLDWFDLLDQIERDLENDITLTLLFSFLDELYMRKLDSISEGASYKLKAPTRRLLIEFEKLKDGATQQEIKQFKGQADSILK